ncbi:MAG TPA: DUF1592 domain-containing protein [Bryobacterales bacterium]|nr:DUF1592 domain-containing protein [Bryobacterales bacterium]
MTHRSVALFGFLGVTSCFAATPRIDPGSFQSAIQPFVAKHCVVCHNAKLKTGGLNFEAFHNTAQALKDRAVWEHVEQKLRSGLMPPKGLPRPTDAEIQTVTRWIDAELDRLDQTTRPDPGRVTTSRLNRYEYNNTIRDLLGVNFRPADDFPADDSGYGFDNIGDVLSLSPVLMEKYLAAAEKIARLAIVADPPPKPTVERYKAERPYDIKTLPPDGAFSAKHKFPVEADYDVRAGFAGRAPVEAGALQMALWVDGRQVKVYDVEFGEQAPRFFDVRIPVKPGEHELKAAFLPPYRVDDFSPDGITPVGANVTVDYLEVRGPYNPVPPPLPESHKRIFICGHPNGQHKPECARLILSNLARRAYRRSVTDEEVEKLTRFVTMAQAQGDTFEQGIRVALEAALVSPYFLFRMERDPAPDDPKAVHAINDFELASRLSYFLWSSMPDEELFRLAEEHKLRQPGVLEAQVERMLKDPKSRALVEDFAGQWLELRNLDTIKPDPDRFPEFNDELRAGMRQETRLFFETIVHEDRSILDFLDAKFTFLNERLAKFYGIPGVEGSEFRRVDLKGGERSGILTQASILTVSSYPTRTSPVIRGKWLLENILGDPPPPPPPGVPNLNEAAIGATASMRQQLEQHRANPTCASCHARMDPLGFGLENYDAIGRWRTMDGKFPIDSSGTLPNGKTFQGPAGLKAILLADKDAFARCLTEKMLTYALGRGLEPYDQPAVRTICRQLAEGDYRFSLLVIGIVKSAPFEMRRGDGGKT